MDQCSILRFLHLKGLDATRIHHELEVVLGPHAMPYSIVTRTRRSAIWTQTEGETPGRKIEDTIVQALGELPFASVKELARRLCCAPTTIYHHFTESLHFASKHLQWVPHDLTTGLKGLRVEKSNEPVGFIKPVRPNLARHTG
jgi:hypothetical protein